MQLIEKWAVLELSGELTSASVDAQLYPSQAMPLFFEWQLRDELFDFGIAYGAKNHLLTIIEAVGAKTNVPLLERSARSGWELLVATKSTLEDIVKFFSNYGYRQVSETALQFTSNHELFSWNGINLSSAITLAERLESKQLCIFAHDADPIYILQRLS